MNTAFAGLTFSQFIVIQLYDFLNCTTICLKDRVCLAGQLPGVNHNMTLMNRWHHCFLVLFVIVSVLLSTKIHIVFTDN